MSDDLHVGGEKLFGWSAIIAQAAVKFVTGFGIFAVTVLFIGMDVFLMAHYLTTVAQDNGFPIHGWAKLTPWVITLCTQGVLYALWARPEKFKARHYVDKAALAIAFFDTLGDIGGGNAFFFHDKNVESNIFLPLSAPHLDLFLQVVIGGICFAHMPLLRIGLQRFQHRVDRDAGATFGDQIEAGLIYGAGWVFSLAQAIAIPFGGVAMVFLDLILTPLVGNSSGESLALFVLSFALTFIQYFLWNSFIHVARGTGGGLTKGSFQVYRKQMSKETKWVWRIAVLCTLIDSLFDLAGFNKILFGHAGLIPPSFSIAWVLVSAILLIICSMQSMLVTELFDPIARHYNPMRKDRSF